MKKADFEERWPEMMRKAQNGDRVAYRQLLEEIGPRVDRYLQRRIRREEDIPDLHQSVLLNVHAGRHTYDARRPFEPWLFAIARHSLNRYLKKESRQRAYVELVDMVDGRADPAAERTVESMMGEALAKMTEEQRTAFRLVKMDGLTLREAARETGSSVSAVKSRAHRAYEIFRNAVKEMR
jgi:RNA polymerase sigma-70 factor (ECF subfamily)